MVNRQQYEVDRMVAQSRRIGCETSGFLLYLQYPPPQCGGIVRQINQQRNALERMRNDLERLNGGTAERAAQRRGLLIALGRQLNAVHNIALRPLPDSKGDFGIACLATTAVAAWCRRHSVRWAGIFRTVCVRTCDGFYFPISYSTSPDRFRED